MEGFLCPVDQHQSFVLLTATHRCSEAAGLLHPHVIDAEFEGGIIHRNPRTPCPEQRDFERIQEKKDARRTGMVRTRLMSEAIQGEDGMSSQVDEASMKPRRPRNNAAGLIAPQAGHAPID